MNISLRTGSSEICKLTRGGGSTARLGGRELTLLCGFNQYTLLQSRDNSGLLGTSLYCSLKLGGRCPPNAQVGGAAAPPAPPVEPPLLTKLHTYFHHIQFLFSFSEITVKIRGNTDSYYSETDTPKEDKPPNKGQAENTLVYTIYRKNHL